LVASVDPTEAAKDDPTNARHASEIGNRARSIVRVSSQAKFGPTKTGRTGPERAVDPPGRRAWSQSTD
jgi:hypothetical protein